MHKHWTASLNNNGDIERARNTIAKILYTEEFNLLEFKKYIKDFEIEKLMPIRTYKQYTNMKKSERKIQQYIEG